MRALSLHTCAFSYSFRVSEKFEVWNQCRFNICFFWNPNPVADLSESCWDALRGDICEPFSISCRNIYDRELAHFWHGPMKWWRRDWWFDLIYLRETNFVLSRRFVTRDLLLKLINNNLCDKKNRSVFYILFLLVRWNARWTWIQSWMIFYSGCISRATWVDLVEQLTWTTGFFHIRDMTVYRCRRRHRSRRDPNKGWMPGWMPGYCDPTLVSDVLIIRRSKMPCAIYEFRERRTEHYGDGKQHSLADRAYQRSPSERLRIGSQKAENPTYSVRANRLCVSASYKGALGMILFSLATAHASSWIYFLQHQACKSLSRKRCSHSGSKRPG